MELDYRYFNTFDTLIILALLFSLIVGFYRGFIREFLGLASWAGAFYSAMMYHHIAESFLGKWISEPLILQWASYLLIFCSSLILFLAMAQGISFFVQKTIAVSIDRSFGLIFGALRGFCIICFLYLGSLFFVFPHNQPSLIKLSISYNLLNRTALWLAPKIPSFLSQQGTLKKSVEELSSPINS